MTATTAQSRASRRKPPEPATRLLTDAQIVQLLEQSQQVAAALDQATATLETQNQRILALIEVVGTGKALQRRFAAHLLGVPAGVAPAELRQAYRVLAKTHHPDAGGDAEAFDLLQVALRVLEGP
jgi:hypothetical protein